MGVALTAGELLRKFVSKADIVSLQVDNAVVLGVR